MSTSRLVPTKDAARILRVTPRQIARLVESGALTPATRGDGPRGPFFFEEHAVEQLREERQAAWEARWAS